jgi:flagellar motor switch protein FliN/FliY
MIDEIGKIITEATESVLPMLMPKQVEISLKGVKEWQPQAFPDPMVLVTTNFSEGPSGSVYFLVSTANVSIIVDLMLGGSGASDRSMNEESVDAVKELMNQILGVTATNMREEFDGQFSFEQVEVHSLEAEMDLGLLLDDVETSMVEIGVDIEAMDDFVVMGCFPQPTVESIADVKEGKTEEKEEPAEEEGTQLTQDAIDQIKLPEGFEMVPPTGPPIEDEDAEPEMPQKAPPKEQGEGTITLPNSRNIGLLLDIELPIIIRLGSTEMQLKDVMRLGPGAIIELNKSVDEPVELLVNEVTIARGEVVVVDGNFAFRVTEVESRAERVKSLQ